MGRARMYNRRAEIRVRKSAAKAMLDKMYQVVQDKTITTSEITCSHCGFKARYQFIRCPHCGEERK